MQCNNLDFDYGFRARRLLGSFAPSNARMVTLPRRFGETKLRHTPHTLVSVRPSQPVRVYFPYRTTLAASSMPRVQPHSASHSTSRPASARARTCQVERRAVSALRVSAVDIVSREQPLQPRQVALLGGIQECRVAEEEVGHLLVRFLHQVQRCVAVPVLLTSVRAVLQRVVGREGGEVVRQMENSGSRELQRAPGRTAIERSRRATTISFVFKPHSLRWKDEHT